MRNIVLSLGVSIDGYIARRNGGVDFLFMPKDYPRGAAFTACDTAIMGRKTLDVGLKMSAGSLPEGFRYYAFSYSQPPGERNGVTFVNESPAALVKKIRKARGKDIWLMGGGELARDFLKADLVDEIHLGIVPVLLGDGIRLFPGGFPQRDFSLLDSKSYSRGLVELKYKRARTRDKPKAQS